MKEFYELTNRGRAMRLRRLARAAQDHYDFEVIRLRLLSNNYNGIFRVETTGGQKYVIRVCLPYPEIEGLLHAEWAWLDAIAQETNLLVPKPVAARDGRQFVTIQMADVPEPRHCVVFSWLRGANLADQLSAQTIEPFGAYMARLHQHASGYSSPYAGSLRIADKVFHVDKQTILFDEPFRMLMPPSRRKFFESVVRRIEEATQRLKDSGEAPRVIHGDLHRWNVKVWRGQIAAFDFEELYLGWPVQDIGTTLHYFYGEEGFPAIRAAFRRGYESVLPWPERYDGEVDTFIAGRNMVLANTILQSFSPEERAEAAYYFETTEARLRALLAGEPFHLRYW